MRTTRTERRGFESERRTGINRRIELGGASAAVVERVEEVFGGKTRSAEAAARRAACRLRWGRSLDGVDGSFGVSLETALELDSGIEDVNAPLLELLRAFLSRELAEKYPFRSRGASAA